MTWKHRNRHRGRGRSRFPEAFLAMQFGGWRGADFGGRHGRKRRKRMFDSGELRLVLLKLIADESRHGYDLIGAIEELTDGAYTPSPGIIYPTLNLLEDSGMIEQEQSKGARKAFSITDEGQAELTEKKEEVDALIARLSKLGEREQKASGGPVRRAMGNLFVVLGNRLSQDDVDEDTVQQVTAILDDAAQRIEQL